MYVRENARDPMITLTLTRGEGENSLAASGTRYQGALHETFTVIGKLGAVEEDGKTPIGLKFIYAESWGEAELEGKFDPEEKSLRGTLKLYSGMALGAFVFKRSPLFVRFYPSPSTMTARKRWEYATKVVLDKIRRESWSPAYLLQRIKDGKRYMDIAIRMRYFGKPVDHDDEEEYTRLFTTMLAGDAQFYASLITVKVAAVLFQYVHSDHEPSTPHLQVPPTQQHSVQRLRKRFSWCKSPLHGLSRQVHRRLLFGTRMPQLYHHARAGVGPGRATHTKP